MAHVNRYNFEFQGASIKKMDMYAKTTRKAINDDRNFNSEENTNSSIQ